MTDDRLTQMRSPAVVEIFTDGACVGNPGQGGYAAILKMGERRREISGGFRETTNNRMELMAAIVGLEALKKPCRVKLYSDSRYLVDAYNKGDVRRWQANGWMRTRREAAENVDLWERLLELCAVHQVEMVWVEGHAGHPENERCDRLATSAAQGKDLPPDAAFEAGTTHSAKHSLFG